MEHDDDRSPQVPYPFTNLISRIETDKKIRDAFNADAAEFLKKLADYLPKRELFVPSKAQTAALTSPNPTNKMINDQIDAEFHAHDDKCQPPGVVAVLHVLNWPIKK